jgi:hypothetical protein
MPTLLICFTPFVHVVANSEPVDRVPLKEIHVCSIENEVTMVTIAK